MMKPNYAFAKRQKDLAKKAKQAQKQARKREKSETTGSVVDPVPLAKPSA